MDNTQSQSVKTNVAKSLIQYLKEAYVELKKVDWPNRKQTIRQTLVVIAVSAATAIFLGALDYIFSTVLKFVLQ